MIFSLEWSSINFIDVNDNNFAGITFNQFRIAKHIYKIFKNLKKLR